MLRRFLQFGALGFVVYGGLNTAWRNYKVAHNLERLVTLMEGPFWGKLYAWNEDALSLWGEPFRSSFDFLGMPWAGVVAGVPIVDPLLLAGVTISGGPPPAGLWLSALIPLVLAALAARLFCSHICPMRLLFELGQRVRGGLLYLGVPLPNFKLSARLGGWVLLGGLLATVSAGPVVWLLLLPYAGLSAGIFLGISAGVAGGLLVVPAVLLAIDVLVAPSAFCHSLCPTGWLLETTGQFAPFQLRKDTARDCPSGCHACERACPYTLSPKEMQIVGCDRCGACVSACPDDKLSRGLVLGRLVRPEELAA